MCLLFYFQLSRSQRPQRQATNRTRCHRSTDDRMNVNHQPRQQQQGYHAVDTDDWPAIDGFRFVNKNGHINVDYSSMGRLKNMHSNLILFVMQAEWWLVLTFVLLSFIVSWYIFAFLYFLISIEHGDFVLMDDEDILGENLTNLTLGERPTEREMCVKDVHNFLSALLFSIETQQSIGYGSRYITTECMGGILVLTLQSSLGYLLQVIVTQIVFSKLSRPTGNNAHEPRPPCPLHFYPREIPVRHLQQPSSDRTSKQSADTELPNRYMIIIGSLSTFQFVSPSLRQPVRLAADLGQRSTPVDSSASHCRR